MDAVAFNYVGVKTSHYEVLISEFKLIICDVSRFIWYRNLMDSPYHELLSVS